MQNYTWPDTFREVYNRAAANYRQNRRTPATLLASDDQQRLASIGCSSQELFDFIEDLEDWGDPSFETVLLITSVRRDYFLAVQNGRLSLKRVNMDTLPPKSAAMGGFEWLPRIIVKARAKLAGEMPPELMYDCGGDRAFLHRVKIHPADFLRVVWAAGDDDAKILQYVQQASKKA